MASIFEITEEVLAVLHAQGIRYCLAGGLAMAEYVQGRATEDIDFCVYMDAAVYGSFEEALRVSGRTIHVSRMNGMTTLLLDGIRVYLLDPVTAVEQFMVSSATQHDLWHAGIRVMLPSVEALFLVKVAAGQYEDRHRLDAKSLLDSYKEHMDHRQLARWLASSEFAFVGDINEYLG